jgi:Ca2+-binding RTX toxin-like protein
VRRALLMAMAASAVGLAPAHAAMISGTADVTFKAESGEENALTVVDEGETVRFREAGAPLTVTSTLCRLDGSDAVCSADGHVRVITADGDDRYRGSAPADLGAGDDVGRGESLRGRRGDDWLRGTRREDLLLGGHGHDVIHAGRGADVIDAGEGRDVALAGPGRDDVNVLDGQRDVVNCGSGRDAVVADARDVLVSCEHR